MISKTKFLRLMATTTQKKEKKKKRQKKGYFSKWRLDWHLRFVLGARISPSLQTATSGFDKRIVVWLLAGLNYGCWSDRIYLWSLRLVLDFFLCGSGTVVGRDWRRWWCRANMGDGPCGVLGYLFILGNLLLIEKKKNPKIRKSGFN